MIQFHQEDSETRDLLISITKDDLDTLCAGLSLYLKNSNGSIEFKELVRTRLNELREIRKINQNGL